MPSKKRLRKELPAEGSSQAAGEQDTNTAQTTMQTTPISQTLHLQPSTNIHAATIDPTEQPTTQTVVLAMNTSAPNNEPPPSHQHQTIETQEDLQ
jgi:hypothetical protein